MARQPAVVAGLNCSIEPLDYEYGGWCPTCLLPTGVHVTAMVTIGPSAHLRVFDRCTDCLGPAEPPEARDVDHL